MHVTLMTTTVLYLRSFCPFPLSTWYCNWVEDEVQCQWCLQGPRAMEDLWF